MKRNRLAIVIAGILAIAASANAQAFDLAFNGIKQFIPLAKQNVAAILLKNKVSNAKNNIGTGFVVLKNVNGTNDSGIIVITCFHVINIPTPQNSQLLIALNDGNTFKEYDVQLIGADQSHDIAILKPIPTGSNPKQVSNIPLRLNEFTPDSLVQEGASIIIPGYPLGLGIEYSKNSPIVKTGFIAQKSNDSIYVADFIANPGNSGSPVYELPSHTFIGMVASYNTDGIHLYNETGALVASLPYNSGLANIISAKCIKNVLNATKLMP
jgi:S1-C subfamily serine protease